MTVKRVSSFEAFKKLVPYLRGALWWSQNDLIKRVCERNILLGGIK